MPYLEEMLSISSTLMLKRKRGCREPACLFRFEPQRMIFYSDFVECCSKYAYPGTVETVPARCAECCIRFAAKSFEHCNINKKLKPSNSKLSTQNSELYYRLAYLRG